MTNCEIIEKEELALIATGGLKEGEHLHTFQGWKQLGFIVKRGSHAMVTTKLWKKCKEVKTTNKHENLGIGCDEVETKENNEKTYKDFILVKSFLFSSSQVEKL